MLMCCCNIAMGQTYNNISHSSGSQTIANLSVNVTSVGVPGMYPGGSFCNIGPYQIGSGTASPNKSSGYTYTFSRAVKEVRFKINASEPGEVISVKLNGVNYSLASSNIGSFANLCGITTGNAINTNGQLYFTSGGNINTQIRIIDSIKSITITDIDTVGGSVMSVDFVTDTMVEINNYVDTVLCVGDTVDIPYRIAGYFSPGNQFIFQLSDKNGSFASPTVLTTVSGSYSGIASAIIPVVLPSDAYRIRVVSTSPVYVSKPFPVNIAIGQMPIAVIYNTGPACVNNFAQIGYSNFSHFTEVRWSRWGGAVFSKLQHYPFQHVQFSDSGLYVAEMQDYGCVVRDTTRLRIKPNPLIVTAINNSPLCAGDTLKLQANLDTAGVINVWLKPDGNTDTLASLQFPNITEKDSGRYVLITRQDGCLGFDTVKAVIKHRPEIVLEDISICFGDALRLHAKDTTSGIVYMWSGPSGFAASVKDTVISPAYFTRKGAYTLRASLNGCIATDTLIADIRPLPLQPVAMADTALCAGGDIQLGIKEKIAGTGYSWSGPSGFSAQVTDTLIKHVATTASGRYIVTALLDGCTTADTANVLVKRAPQKPIISSNSPIAKGGTLMLKIDNLESGINYSWRGPAGFATSILAPEIKNAESWQSGMYVLVATLDKCLDSTTLQVQISDEADTGNIVLYPNPNNGDFYLKGILHKDQLAEIKITNDAGQVVYRTSVPVADKKLYHNVRLRGALASGIYMLKLWVDGDYKVFKLLVKRD